MMVLNRRGLVLWLPLAEEFPLMAASCQPGNGMEPKYLKRTGFGLDELDTFVRQPFQGNLPPEWSQ